MSNVSSPPVLDSRAVDALHRDLNDQWPQFDVPLSAFVQYLRERHLAGGVCVYAADLYLACACLRGASPALKVLEREYLDPVLELVRCDPRRDDLRQTVLERLLAHRADQLPRLAEYSGRASLRTWLRVVAKRTQLNLMRGQTVACQVGADDLVEQYILPVGSDPEFEYVRVRCATEFKRAFRVALGRLNARDRLLLRLSVLEGRTGEDVAALFGVTRATVVRWLAELRRQLCVQTRLHLQAELQLSQEELDSVVRFAGSALDVSLSQLEEAAP